MAGFSMLGGVSSIATDALAPKADQLIHQSASDLQNKKIEKSANDFESMLMSSWLQQSEKSFGSLPGTDDDEDDDSGKEQYMGMAMQSMGAAMTAAGGIGISKMISDRLHQAADRESKGAEKTASTHTK